MAAPQFPAPGHPIESIAPSHDTSICSESSISAADSDSANMEYCGRCDGPRPTVGFVCGQTLPKFIRTFEPRRPPDTFYVPPLLTIYKDALDSYQLQNPSQHSLPTLVTHVPHLIDEVYKQFQIKFSEKLAQHLDENCWLFWRLRERKDYDGEGCWPRCPSGGTYEFSIGNLILYVCNQISRGESNNVRDRFYGNPGLQQYGSFSCSNRKAKCTLLVVEFKATRDPSIIIQTCDWVGDGRHLDYNIDFEDSRNAMDTPQITTQKLIASMTFAGVTSALLMDSEFYCFATLVPFEDPPAGHFLVLSRVFKMHHNGAPPAFGTLAAMLIDRSPQSDFKIRWPSIQPPLVEAKVGLPTSTLSDHCESQLPNLCNPQHRTCDDFSLVSNCSVWLDYIGSTTAPLKLTRIPPSAYPWDKDLRWPNMPSLPISHPTANSRHLYASLGKKLGYGRSGTVYQVHNTSLVAKFAVYNDYERCPTMAIESSHIEATLYETLLVPLQGRIVPRYYGLFSNHPSKMGNHRMLVLEDCGRALGGGEDFSPFDFDIRSEVYSLISEIIDCGINYCDPAPRNICVGVDGKSLRVIDFDACNTFPNHPKLRAIAQLQAKGWLCRRLSLPDTTTDNLVNFILSEPRAGLIQGTATSEVDVVDMQQSVAIKGLISLPETTQSYRSGKRKRSNSAPLQSKNFKLSLQT